MKPTDEILLIEEKKWRAKSYQEIESILNEVQCYEVKKNNKSYVIEIHTKKGNRPDEIVIMVECSRGFFGKAKYFVNTKYDGVRDVRNDEFF